MKKDRFVAFFDAVMAIIMTIVVLEFVIPSGTDWSDLTVLAFQIIAYAVSFFWLGGMWINIHGIWQDVEEIDRPILWTNIALLFFASMIPFFTVYFGRNITERVPAMLYSIDVMLITLTNLASIEMLARKNEKIRLNAKRFAVSEFFDLGVKTVGIIVGITVFPSAILISVLVSIVLLAFVRITVGKKQGKDITEEKNRVKI